MSAEEISQNGLNTQFVFQDDPLRFNCGPTNRRVGGDPGPKTTTRELAGFIDDKLFSSSAATNDRYFPSGPEFPRNMYRNWNGNGNGNGTSGEESDGDDAEDEDMDDDDEDDDVEGGDDNSNSNNDKSNINKATTTTTSTTTGNNNVDKIIGNGNGKPKQHSSFGGVMVMKDGGGSIGQTGNNNNAVTIAEADGEIYYSQYLQANEGSGNGGKDMALENGCGFSGRKEASSFSSDSGDSLRAILSDPVTGALMDDAMILPCGHSFGVGGIQHIIRTKACYTCSQSTTEDSVAPNLSLRAAVQAFRREEELQFYRSSKRKRERFDQDKGGFGDSTAMDAPRGRGVQFPFAVTDRVIIKGNKRTPQRFVGREAVVTTQCLNGWYVVKTLDNAESVKLQYRSLAKVSDAPSGKALSSKIPPNWL
ncbi:U-box domain-containing protein 62 isoform X2 [Ricinus communis]|uniref:U-box domain-containing protein 62 isoform X2 n=1 Tax=Ricinus communis TaxID=3988 RepID=UPI00201AF232|nr:U-box domain-containing protein 62 isoform X2 [Ricinus communis]